MTGKKVVMGLSGGMDSSTLLGYLFQKEYSEIHCCIFTYGSKHNKYENNAAMGVAAQYMGHPSEKSVFIHAFNLTEVMQGFKSNLLLSGEEIPEGHYNDETMKKTVVPGRNMIFISIMAGYAESVGADTVALGVHAGDHHIYPDCREEFISSVNATVGLSTDGKVKVIAPFQHYDKYDILKIGYGLSPVVPYHLTRTCYKDQLHSCGKCGSCQERLEAFGKLMIKDPIQYQ